MNRFLVGCYSGIIAGIIMGIIVSIANMLNLTSYHSIKIAAGIFLQEVFLSPGLLWTVIGWVVHLQIAIIYGVIINYLLQLSGSEYCLQKGLFVGGFSWLFDLGIVAPVIGYNIMTNLNASDLLFSFVLHLFFGTFTAWLIMKLGK